MGHLDVVPIVPGTEAQWSHPPFAGDIADGHVWGRGTLDDKSSVIAVLEAVEKLAGEGYRPRRTIYLAFGHDEEVGGPEGAAKVVEALAARGVTHFAFVADEGGAVGQGLVPGIDKPTALIGVAEKGYLNLRLTVAGEGGHSSTPPAETNVGILSRAVARLEATPFPARLEGAARDMFDYLGPEMSFGPNYVRQPVAAQAARRAPDAAAPERGPVALRRRRHAERGGQGQRARARATAVVNFASSPARRWRRWRRLPGRSSGTTVKIERFGDGRTRRPSPIPRHRPSE
jgi:carboxypeptidase PM20D1